MGDSIHARIKALYGKYSSWRLVGFELANQALERGIIDHVNGHVEQYGALANAVYRGAAQDSPTLRAVLGLPPKAVPVPPCPDCGQVHEQLHTCDEERRRARRTKANGWHRRAVWFHESELPQLEAEMASAGCSNFTEYVDYLRKVNQ